MEKQTAEMIDKKIRFISSLEKTLLFDKCRNGLSSIEYKLKMLDEAGDKYEEYILLKFEGSAKRIYATGNSNGANALAILKEVY